METNQFVVDWEHLPLAVLVIALTYLFIIVGAAASDYFCVNISTLAFHLPTSIAAILLSLANASPDLFSTFTAATNDGLNLAVGELIGSAAFVTTFIAGCIGLYNPSSLHSSLFIKNMVLFIILLVFIDVFMEFKALPLSFSLLSLTYYFIYLIFILGHENVLNDPVEECLDEISDTSDSINAVSEPLNPNYSGEVVLNRNPSLPLLIPVEEEVPFFSSDSYTIEPPSRFIRICKIAMHYIILPISLILSFSCPVIFRMEEISDEDSFTMSINELVWRSSVFKRKCQGFFGTLFIINMVYGWFNVPIVRITIILAILVSLGVSLIFDQFNLKLVLVFGVVISASIVQNSANVMVTILKILCDKLDLSQGIIGLTIFALGNSLGDLITNLTLAKMGHTQIAYAATLSSPVLCLSVGLGASTLYLNIKKADNVELDPTLFWLLRLLIVDLLFFLVLMKCMNYELNRKTSLYLIISYLTILSTSMLLGKLLII
eukprot:NODE_875_length_3523_cov_0.099007.p1 type:complete len:490 gc:universal NODE_875_length_3523_cov_0.099007:1344-2813(+)